MPKQLGLRESKLCTINSSIFGQSNLPIVYSDVACAGWETHLLECSRKQHSSHEFTDSYPLNAQVAMLLEYICSDGM